MLVYLLTLRGDSLTYTLASAIAHCGHQVVVLIADADLDRESVWGLSRPLSTIPGVRVIADSSDWPTSPFERLIVQARPPLLAVPQILNRLAPLASSITAISVGDRSRSYRSALQWQWCERLWYGKWFKRVTRVAYKDGYYAIDLMGPFKSRSVIGFDAHSKFLRDPALRRTLHAQDWSADSNRPILANFLGSRDPAIRERALSSVEPIFLDQLLPQTASKMLRWHAYTDAQPAPLAPEDFLSILSNSDFTLCPPGYSLITHRPVEALLRGSIPMLHADELDLYELELKDGVNCIAVTRDGWAAAMRRIAGFDEMRLREMRETIRSLVVRKVQYESIARGICGRLGLGG